MRFKLKEEVEPKPKPVAVVGACGFAIFLPVDGDPHKCIYLSGVNGYVKNRNQSLEEVLNDNQDRVAVYKGDTVEVKF